MLKNIGLTPLKRLNKSNIYLKLEGYNPSGSIKDRTISNMIINISEQKLRDKPTVIVSSGSAGLSLYHVYNNYNLMKENDSIVVLPLKYSNKTIPKYLLNKPDVKIFYSFESLLFSQNNDNKGFKILLINDIFINILKKAKIVSKLNQWNILDQHYNKHCVEAHKQTADEIVTQLPNVTDVVCSTGTGGTAAGLIKFLPQKVKVHARPTKSGEIEGLTDVGRYNNFCDTSSIEDYYDSYFEYEKGYLYKEKIKNEFIVGVSTGASLCLAENLCKDNKRNIVVISANGITNPKLSN